MKLYAVVTLPSFKADVRKRVAYDPTRAEAIADAIEAASLLLHQFPDLGHPVRSTGSGR